jgi:predicted aspartyl protease
MEANKTIINNSRTKQGNNKMQKEEYKPEAAKQYANRHNRFENDVCSVEYIVTTPAIIEKLLDGNLRNRRLNAGHMKKLSIDIKNGKYVFNGQPIIRDANGYLRDGQHRLIALKEAGYPPVPILLVTLKGDLSHIEQAYDRMDINKSRTYSQRLEHKGLDHAKTIAALRKKITYIKTNFNSFPVVPDSVYDEVGAMYAYEIEAVAPLVNCGFTADMGAAVCLIAKATGLLEDCVQMIKKAKAGEMLKISTPEHTLMKIINKTLRTDARKQGRNAFNFAVVANGLIAGLQGKNYVAADSNSLKACKWILEKAIENEVKILPKSMKDA